MSIFLKKYFLILFIVFFSMGILSVSYFNEPGKLKPSDYAWMIVLFTLLIIVIVRRYNNIYPKYPRGKWTSPDKKTLFTYLFTSIIVSITDIFPKLILFKNTEEKNEILNGFGVQSFFNPDPLSFKIAVVMLLFTWIFFIGPLYFRFHSGLHDKLWVVLSSVAFSASIILTVERLLFKGIHDIFYFEDRFRYLCPSCGLKYQSYIWCPADILLNWSILFLLFLYSISAFKSLLKYL